MVLDQLGTSDMWLTPVGFGAWAVGGGNWAYGWGPQDDSAPSRPFTRPSTSA